MEDNKQLREIADYYGMELQTEKLIEECAELCAAAARLSQSNTLCLCDTKRLDALYDNFFEEMADVLNVIEQLVYLCEAEDTVNRIQQEKIERTLRKIRAEQIEREGEDG